MSGSRFFEYLSDGVTVRSKQAAGIRLIYAPLCGPDGSGIKSSITPLLSGDIKVDKSSYLTKPASREDLRQPLRNFFVRTEEGTVVSLADEADKDVTVELGQLWHKVTRAFPAEGLELQATTFVPSTGENLELTKVTLRNTSDKAVTLTPTAAIPLFGRSLSNKHDHEHVTALLNRVEVASEGVCLRPSMRFNEEGHKPSHTLYYVFGVEGNGQAPQGVFPTFESFLGEGGSWEKPEAVSKDLAPRVLSAAELQGKETVGALRFARITLKPGESREYILAVGIDTAIESARKTFQTFAVSDRFDAALKANQAFWSAKTSTLSFSNGDTDFSGWMRWVTLQPILRRIFGCSFLPDHDYGKGGKGWRDIWQDLLSLILIEPETVRGHLLNNFAGVRVDGTNATIIGQRPGEFIADRNAITRVWMDHGVWPFTTTLLYMDQTGDKDFLFEDVAYFADVQMSRTTAKNTAWKPEDGNQLKTAAGAVYKGTVLEHILIQHLVQFYNVGEHNMIRLESADWNDGLDMAAKRGESVAFSSFYAGNLLKLAALLEKLHVAGKKTVRIGKELLLLTDTLSSPVDYNSIDAKKARLFSEYFPAVQPVISGARVDVDVQSLAQDLRQKGEWLKARINAQEKVSFSENGETLSWFNGYYDNNGERLEGKKNGRVWMTLTGQVFPLMHGIASREDTASVVRAARKFLKDKDLGSYRLNTDFGLPHYLSMGRAFGFAFGTKENGAVFSHMTVMYAYALYAQGFARDGYEVLRSLYEMSTHPENAKIYPGVPEYFDSLGRGMYHFLTGSASWYVLTLLTMAYGVRGECGDLLLAPALVREEFGPDGTARVAAQFAGRQITVSYVNARRLDHGQYKIEKVFLNGVEAAVHHKQPGQVLISRNAIAGSTPSVEIKVVLS